MKSRFFYGVFVGFILGCLFFFGVMNVNAQTPKAVEYQANYTKAYDANYSAANYLTAYNYAYKRGAADGWDNGRAEYCIG
jgi:hypothetical protein